MCNACTRDPARLHSLRRFYIQSPHRPTVSLTKQHKYSRRLTEKRFHIDMSVHFMCGCASVFVSSPKCIHVKKPNERWNQPNAIEKIEFGSQVNDSIFYTRALGTRHSLHLLTTKFALCNRKKCSSFSFDSFICSSITFHTKKHSPATNIKGTNHSLILLTFRIVFVHTIRSNSDSFWCLSLFLLLTLHISFLPFSINF